MACYITESVTRVAAAQRRFRLQSHGIRIELPATRETYTTLVDLGFVQGLHFECGHTWASIAE